MKREIKVFGALAIALCCVAPATADEAQIARGRYIVSIAGCSDCHTPGGMLGSPDMKRYLGGSDVGFSIPTQGVFVGQNLYPRQGDRARPMDGGSDRHRNPQGQAAGWERTQRRDALRVLLQIDRRRRFRHRRLSPEPASGKEQGAELQIVGQCPDLGVGGAAAGNLQRPARLAEIGAFVLRDAASGGSSG